jgi:PhzF family phenazine biosynthesis protein
MRKRPFKQIDVFTNTPFCGNPVAVVLDAQDLRTDQMQAIARWTNLSETTFVLPATHAQADYRLRIFTPVRELPFAGHPTLGSAYAVLESGMVNAGQATLTQQCEAGLISLTRDKPADRLWLRAPALSTTPLSEAQQASLNKALGVSCIRPALRIDVGPVWITAQVAHGEHLLAACPDQVAIQRISEELNATGITVFGANDDRAGFEVRSFAPLHGIAEDPVCGSGNVCVAAFLAAHGSRTPYEARQGRAIGRDGLIAVRYLDNDIEIGGQCVTCVDGFLYG